MSERNSDLSIKYSPFLKLKQNEVKAIEELDDAVACAIRPLFDIPRTTKNQSEAGVVKRIDMGHSSLEKLYENLSADVNLEFYIDNHDIDDDILISGICQYSYILNKFKSYEPIPVLAFDRNPSHNASALNYLATTKGKIALRLQREDLESYKLSKPAIDEIMKNVAGCGCEEVHLLIDLRLVSDHISDAVILDRFLKEICKDYFFDAVISAGSIIPSNISELIKTDASKHEIRKDKEVWDLIQAKHDVQFGDYGVVSPDYSDADLDPKLLRLVSTPKVFYSYLNNFFVVRGSSLHYNPKGNNQFFDIADAIAVEAFYRKAPYSYGDKYINDRSTLSPKRPAKAGSQGSWIKATLAAHITYIVNTI